jgi:hypothetical protein
MRIYSNAGHCKTPNAQLSTAGDKGQFYAYGKMFSRYCLCSWFVP